MAITTVNQLLSGMQPLQAYNKVASGTMVAGRPFSWWGFAGGPGAGAFDTTLNGVTRSQTGGVLAGAIPYFDPPGGVNGYLARFQGTTSGTGGTLLLLDRLWENGGITITSTSLQSITSPTFPARDNTGTTAGAGVLLAVEVSAVTGAGTPTLTVGYTNSSGTASRSATNVDATLATSVAGTFYRIGLQSGDVGVQSVQSLTLSATWMSGTINMVAYRVLAAMEAVTTLIPNAIDGVTGGLPQLFNGVTPFVAFIPGAVTSTLLTSQFIAAQG